MLSLQARLGLLLIVVPVLYELNQPKKCHDNVLSQLAGSWEADIRAPRRRVSRVAVGVNANLDLVVSATQLLEALGLSPGQPVDHTHLASAVDLQEQVAYSMLHCAGTERVFTSQAEFQKVVTAARSLPHEHFVGGNAALMAQKIQQTMPDMQVHTHTHTHNGGTIFSLCPVR
jgi:ADP-dependent glucokinase